MANFRCLQLEQIFCFKSKHCHRGWNVSNVVESDFFRPFSGFGNWESPPRILQMIEEFNLYENEINFRIVIGKKLHQCICFFRIRNCAKTSVKRFLQSIIYGRFQASGFYTRTVLYMWVFYCICTVNFREKFCSKFKTNIYRQNRATCQTL